MAGVRRRSTGRGRNKMGLFEAKLPGRDRISGMDHAGAGAIPLRCGYADTGGREHPDALHLRPFPVWREREAGRFGGKYEWSLRRFGCLV